MFKNLTYDDRLEALKWAQNSIEGKQREHFSSSVTKTRTEESQFDTCRGTVFEYYRKGKGVRREVRAK